MWIDWKPQAYRSENSMRCKYDIFIQWTQENSVVYDRDELRRFKSEAIVVAQCIVESQKAELHHRIQQNNWETKDYFPIRRF